ncbi:hypothetical protein J3E69DRAFT_323110 [Trichoderma sp. SZMC 28015]
MHALLTLMFHPIHPVPLAQLLVLVLLLVTRTVATHPVQSGHSAGQLSLTSSLTHARTHTHPNPHQVCPCKSSLVAPGGFGTCAYEHGVPVGRY